MFRANERTLRASMNKDIAEIESQMIRLYTDNLNSIGIQASILATLAYSGINNPFDEQFHYGNGSDEMWFLGYGCNISFMISLIFSLLIMSNTVIAALYGPQLSLLGKSKLAVENAADYMRKKQGFILKCGGIAVAFFMTGCLFQSFENLELNLAIVLAIILLVGLYLQFDSTHEAYFTLYLINRSKAEENADDELIHADKRESGSSWRGKDMLRALTGYESIRRDINHLSDFEESMM